jgi:hypothetical protein
MPALQFILTSAGKNAIINANNTGTNPIVIDRVAIGSASWTPTAAATALQTEIKKISAIGGSVVDDDTIHVTASDSTADTYTVKEVGLYTSGNVLLAIYSQSTAIITKGADTVALIAADLVITGVPAGSVTVGDTTFSYPQATETVKGVLELATTAEAQAGTDDERAITPKKLQDVTGTTTRKGVLELATDAEAQAGTDAVRAVTPAGLRAAMFVHGMPNSFQLPANFNLNSLAVSGFFRGDLGGYTNLPTRPGGETEYDFDLLHLQAPSLEASQMMFVSSTEIYLRVKDGSTWAVWRRLITTADEAAEALKGIIQLATAAQTQAGTDAVKAVTPAGLAALTATTGRRGLIEIATTEEAQAGTDDLRALTPQALQQVTASLSRRGVIELASNAEVQAGTDEERAVTPAGLRACAATTTREGVLRIGTGTEVDAGESSSVAVVPNTLRLYPGTARAWVNFNGSGTVAIRASHGVSSITDRGVGRYTINWDGVFGSSNYCFVACARQINDVSDSCTVSPRASETKGASTLQITVTEGADVQDSTEVCVAAFA